MTIWKFSNYHKIIHIFFSRHTNFINKLVFNKTFQPPNKKFHIPHIHIPHINMNFNFQISSNTTNFARIVLQWLSNHIPKNQSQPQRTTYLSPQQAHAWCIVLNLCTETHSNNGTKSKKGREHVPENWDGVKNGGCMVWASKCLHISYHKRSQHIKCMVWAINYLHISYKNLLGVQFLDYNMTIKGAIMRNYSYPLVV